MTLNFSMSEGMGGQHEFLVRVFSTDPNQSELQVRVLSNWVA